MSVAVKVMVVGARRSMIAVLISTRQFAIPKEKIQVSYRYVPRKVSKTRKIDLAMAVVGFVMEKEHRARGFLMRVEFCRSVNVTR